MKLRGRTASGESVTVHLDIDEPCGACAGTGATAHPAWVEFIDAHRHTGLPLPEIVRIYGEAWWDDHGGHEPPVEAPCASCDGSGHVLTNDGKMLVEALRPYL